MLLVDGNGQEQIFLAPLQPDQPFTPLSNDHSVLRIVNGRFQRRLKDGTLEKFDQEGRLESVTDRNGNATLFQHTSGKLVQIVDPVGLATRLEYEGKRVARMIDPAGRITKFTYQNDNLVTITDPDDNLVAIADRVGSSRKFEYGLATDPKLSPRLMTAQVLKRGNDVDEPFDDDFRETYSFDKAGRVKGGVRVDGKDFTLDAAQSRFLADVEKTITADKSPELFELSSLDTEDTSGLLAHRCGAATNNSAVVETRYLAEAKLQDFHGTKTVFRMTSFGQYHDSRTDDRKTSQVGRNADGTRITAEADGVGNLTCYVYDVYDNVTKITDFPHGPATKTYQYDYEFPTLYAQSFNIPVVTVDEVGRRTEHKLDERGNIIETTTTDPSAPAGSPASVTQFYAYNSQGLRKSAIDGRDNEVTYDYDQYGRLFEIEMPLSTQRFIFNGLSGYPFEILDGNGHTTRYERDSMNRVKKVTNLGNSDTPEFSATVDYDAEGNPVKEINRIGTVTLKSYDELNRPIGVVQDAGRLGFTTTFGYDLKSLKPNYEVRSGDGFEYKITREPTGYDKANHQIAIADPRARGDTDAAEFVSRREFDKVGRIKESTDPFGNKTTYAYDAFDQIKEDVDAGRRRLRLDVRS